MDHRGEKKVQYGHDFMVTLCYAAWVEAERVSTFSRLTRAFTFV